MVRLMRARMRDRVHVEPRRQVTLERDANGVVHVEATRLEDAYYGLGYAHALDRGLQMLLMRILGQGRASEILDGSEEMLRVDTFFRRMGWAGRVEAERALLSKEAYALCEAYAEGVNACLARRRPWGLRLLHYTPEPWRLEDSVLLLRMIGYLTLAESQGQVERFFVELVQAGVPRPMLEELFPGAVDAYDPALLRQVRLGERIVPSALAFGGVVPRLSASNNWAISGQRTASGHAILASDPHLEVNRLPAVWYEVVLSVSGRWSMGGTIPGLPGVLIGRNNDLAWGATYAFMDAVDSWIEHCRDGQYRRGDRWMAFQRRPEVIRRKGRAPVEVVFWDNEHGTLDGEPGLEGFQLTTRWSGARAGARSLQAVLALWSATTVEEGMAALGRLEMAFHWVLADRTGRIGYQMSGLAPLRRPGWRGFVPVVGWDPENDWRGFAEIEDLPRSLDPAAGFFATANDDLNALGKVKPLTIVQCPYRAERIREVLASRMGITIEDCRALQLDVRSTQAERFMTILRPLLPTTPNARLLATWDLAYDVGSRGASLFERFYEELRGEVFGTRGLGTEIVDYLSGETGIFVDFFSNFDAVLLSESSAWFGGESREAIWRRAAERALAAEPRPWGESRAVMQSHILFGGRLPLALGFDRGPVLLRGGRATVNQGQIYRSAGRLTTFAPSYRLITDLGTDLCFTALAGGPSEGRFSRWYATDMPRWIAGEQKILSVG